MLTIEQSRERWRELLNEFKELRQRVPPITIRITRRNGELRSCVGANRDFSSLAESAVRLLRQCPVSVDVPDETSPADAWFVLLAQGTAADAWSVTATEARTDGTEQKADISCETVSDAVGMSCSVAREIIAELEAAADDHSSPEAATTQPEQSKATIPPRDVKQAPPEPAEASFLGLIVNEVAKTVSRNGLTVEMSGKTEQWSLFHAVYMAGGKPMPSYVSKKFMEVPDSRAQASNRTALNNTIYRLGIRVSVGGREKWVLEDTGENQPEK